MRSPDRSPVHKAGFHDRGVRDGHVPGVRDLDTAGAAPVRRRGVAIILVLAMLLLFSALGVTFSIVARSESQSANEFKKRLYNDVTDDPYPEFRDVIGQIVYDTDRRTSGFRGHSLLRDMYGGNRADPRADNAADFEQQINPVPAYGAVTADDYRNPGGQFAVGAGNEPWYNFWRNAFNGPGIPAVPRLTDGAMATNDANVLAAIRDPLAVALGGTMLVADQQWPYNFTIFPTQFGRDAASNTDYEVRQPEFYTVGTTSVYAGYDEDYDYADHNNWLLGLFRADGTPIIPSMHRPQLVWDMEQRGAFGGNAWSNDDGWRIILRPRRMEYAAGGSSGATTLDNPFRNAGTGFATGAANNRWQDLTDLDGNGIVGDHPSELDVDTDGDGIKDSVWIDYGAAVRVSPDGSFVKPLAAVKVVALNGRLNVNTSGNIALAGATTSALHASHLGYSTAEINLKHALIGKQWSALTDDDLYQQIFTGKDLSMDVPPAPPAYGKYTPAGATPVNTSRAGADGDDDNVAGGGTVTAAGLPNYPGATPIQRFETAFGVGAHRGYLTGDTTSLDPASPYTLAVRPESASAAPYDVHGLYDPSDLNNPAPATYWWGQTDRLGKGELRFPMNAAVPGPHRQGLLPVYFDFERTHVFGDAARGLAMQAPWDDEPSEFDPYNAGSLDDTPFTAEQFIALWRYQDLDADYLSNDQLRIRRATEDDENSPYNVAPADNELFGDAFRSDVDGAQEFYLRRRVRNLFTPLSWDVDVVAARPPLLPTTGTVYPPAVFDTAVPPGFPAGGSVQVAEHDNFNVYGNVRPAPDDTGTSAAIPLFPVVGAVDGALYKDTPAATGLARTLAGRDDIWTQNPGTGGVVGGGGVLNFIVNPKQRVADTTDFTSYASTLSAGFLNDYDLYPRELLEGRRFNLNRPLRPYRNNWTNTAVPADGVNVGAELDRQIMAAQIYLLLRIATHTPDSAVPADQVKIAKLAQLAVNIVDYMDPDDVMTRFHFDVAVNDAVWDPRADMDVVMGFEVPNVTINEAVALFHPEVDQMGTDYEVTWLFAELSNNMPAVLPTNGSDPRAANGTIGATGELVSNNDQMQVGLGTGTYDPTQPVAATDESLTGTNARRLANVYRLEVDLGDGFNATTFENATSTAGAGMPLLHNVRERGRAILGKAFPDWTTGQGSLDDLSHFVVGPRFGAGETTLEPVAGEDELLRQFNYGGVNDPMADGDDAGGDLDYSDNAVFYRQVDASLGLGPAPRPRLRLSRLRNPHQPLDMVENPYVVVDEFELEYSQDPNIAQGFYDIGIDPATMVTRTSLDERRSRERLHPLSEAVAKHAVPTGTDPTHSLSGVPDGGTIDRSHYNKPETALETSEDQYFVHQLNRPLATPLELLMVRMFDFGTNQTETADLEDPRLSADEITGAQSPLLNVRKRLDEAGADPVKHQELTPWFRDHHNDLNPAGTVAYTRNLGGDLFRLFEYVETHDPHIGGGTEFRPMPLDDLTFDYPDFRTHRTPGKVNLNMALDEEVFRGVFDDDRFNPELAEGGDTPATYQPDDSTAMPLAFDAAGPGGNVGTATRPSGQRYYDFAAPDPTAPHAYWQAGLNRLAANQGVYYSNTTIDGATRAWPYAGASPDALVNSEMFRRSLLSIAGDDEVLGTADDRPFRGYAAMDINDTLLRTWTHVGVTANAVPDGSGGSRTADLPRLFDPVDDPTQAGANLETAPFPSGVPNVETYATGAGVVARNQLLAKVANFVTPHSNVFATWITLGYFEVVPGTGDASTDTDIDIPLLGREAGIDEGTNVRRRAFLVIDRSKATGYVGPSQAGAVAEDLAFPLLVGNVQLIE